MTPLERILAAFKRLREAEAKGDFKEKEEAYAALIACLGSVEMWAEAQGAKRHSKLYKG